MTRAHQSGMAHFDVLMWPIYGGRKSKELCTFVAVDERKNSETDSKSGITEIMGKNQKKGLRCHLLHPSFMRVVNVYK